MSGDVVISAKGIPNLSSLNTILPSSSPIRLAASSSRPNVSIVTSPYSVSTYPSVARIPVLWNPLVLLPSITCFLIV